MVEYYRDLTNRVAPGSKDARTIADIISRIQRWKKANAVYVKTPSRLHLALIDLNGDLGRVDGSIGLALDYPNTILEATRSRELKVVGERADFVEDLVRRFLQHVGVKGTIRVSVKNLIPAHVGLGSGTQLSLAVASALSHIFRIRKTTREIAAIMGRGGTSGIGVMAFEKGGLIVDGGHSFGNGKEKQSFLPSSASSAPPPQVIARYEVPQQWICSSHPKCATRVTWRGCRTGSAGIAVCPRNYSSRIRGG